MGVVEDGLVFDGGGGDVIKFAQQKVVNQRGGGGEEDLVGGGAYVGGDGLPARVEGGAGGSTLLVHRVWIFPTRSVVEENAFHSTFTISPPFKCNRR